jgi:hypothetical protein
MLQNAFAGWKEQPRDEDVRAALGASGHLWDELLREFDGRFGLSAREWISYSPKSGWSLRLKKQKRNIVYLSPVSGSFQAVVILGDKAIAAARRSNPDETLLRLIGAGRRYPEGTAIRLNVKDSAGLRAVRQLTEFKLAY